MTTHELANLLEHLKGGLGSCLKADAGRVLDEASSAFRELPDQPLKKLVEHLRKPAAGSTASGKATKKKDAPVDVAQLVSQIRAVRAGTAPADTVVGLDGLSNAQLREILVGFEQQPTRATAANLAKVKQLLDVRPAPVGESPAPRVMGAGSDAKLIEGGVAHYLRLRDTKGLSIPEVRASLAPWQDYPKAVVEEISRQLGYTPHGTHREMLARLQENLEGIKMSQLRTELIGA